MNFGERVKGHYGTRTEPRRPVYFLFEKDVNMLDVNTCTALKPTVRLPRMSAKYYFSNRCYRLLISGNTDRRYQTSMDILPKYTSIHAFVTFLDGGDKALYTSSTHVLIDWLIDQPSTPRYRTQTITAVQRSQSCLRS